jgi:hypothetical protein
LQYLDGSGLTVGSAISSMTVVMNGSTIEKNQTEQPVKPIENVYFFFSQRDNTP